jgi:Holliday junction resolvase-like predicted endonuclease
MRQHIYRLQHRYFFGEIDLVANEHKAFIQVYQHEPILKQCIDVLIGKSSFAKG